MISTSSFRTVGFCTFLAALVFLLYYSGLSGTFLLDDYHTLEPIGWYGRGIDSFQELAQYLFSGNTGPTGRPVALLSFVMTSREWPVPSAYPFVLINVVIHVLNGFLVFLFLRKLFVLCNTRDEIGFRVAIAIACLWVVHPFHVSTVLYVVQRMTLLSVMFSLVALVLYLEARELLIRGCSYKASIVLLGSGFSILLALLSKESVLTLPFQIIVVEWFLAVSGAQLGKWNGAVFKVFILPAALVVMFYILLLAVRHYWDYYSTGVESTYGRSFTMSERLLTELRVVGDYLCSTLVPQMQSSGVFHDGYKVSKGLLAPLSTLCWLLAHLSLLLLAWLFRQRFPFLLFGIFWFYGSHLLESSTIMLELKFDHRNYLASLGVVFIVVHVIFMISQKIVRTLIISGVALIYAILLWCSTSLWGQPLKASMVWVEENPSSARALGFAARQQYLSGQYEIAKNFLRQEIGVSNSPTTELVFIADFCESYNGKPILWKQLARRVEKEPRNWRLYVVLGEIVNDMLAGRCNILSLEDYISLLDAYRNNEAYEGNLSLLLMNENEIKANLAFGKFSEAKLVSEYYMEVPLTYLMNRAGLFARFDQLEYSVSILERALGNTSVLNTEDDYTLDNAREVLNLMRKDLHRGVDQ